ncbi:hypothetical protein Gorai_000400, partial [Gossypium raimondii]|nr:hypothetical protein [Gossypium raimondii]
VFINKIVGVPPQHPSLGPDKIIWGAISTYYFSLKSAYGKIREGNYEDVLRMLRDCLAARTIWDKLIPQQSLSRFYTGSLLDWMTNNLQNHLTLSLDRGILDGLNLILDRRFERVLIQTDSIEAVNAIKDGSSGNFNSTLVRRIHHILEVVKQWKNQHIPQEENSIADSLVKTLCNKRL